jgi:hypothetical protein
MVPLMAYLMVENLVPLRGLEWVALNSNERKIIR